MPMVICEHCRERVRLNQLAVHLKHCTRKRAKDRIQQAKEQKPIYAATERKHQAEALEATKTELATEQAELDVKREQLELRKAELTPEPKQKKANKK